MSDTNSSIYTGAPPPVGYSPRPTPSASPEKSHRQKQSAPDTEEAVPSFMKIDLRPLPVQTLSGETAQAGCLSPVYPLSTAQENTDRTGSAQAMSTLDDQTPDMRFGQPTNIRGGQVQDMQNKQDVDRQCEQSPNRRPADTEPLLLLRQNMASWNANQKNILEFFKACRHCITNHKAIGERLGIPYGTVRNIIRRLTAAGIIQTQPYRDATIQGLEVWYCGPDDGKKQCPDILSRILDGVEQSFRTAPGQPGWTEGRHSSHIEEREKDREKEKPEENLSIWSFSREEIREFWPEVARAGLFSAQLREVKKALELQDTKGNHEKLVAQSLRFLDWQLSKGPIIDQHDEPVKDPIAYWRAAMMRKGFYKKPTGYVDYEEQGLRQLADEENAKLAARRELEQIRLEKEKMDRRDELNRILQALAEEREAHSLWQKVQAEWTAITRAEVMKNPQAILTSPGVSATTRIALRKIFGWPE